MLSFVFCSLFPSDEKRPVSLLDCTHYYPRPRPLVDAPASRSGCCHRAACRRTVGGKLLREDLPRANVGRAWVEHLFSVAKQ